MSEKTVTPTLSIDQFRIVERGGNGRFGATRPVSFDDLASLEGAEKVLVCVTHASMLEENRCEWILLAEARFPRLASQSATCRMVERVLLPPVKEEE